MNKEQLIGDLVEIPPVKTVIRLEEGRTESDEIASSFVFTPEVFSHFTVISDSLLGCRGQGYFLQGDFGSGKSHFLAAVYTWLAETAGTDVLTGRHGGLKRVMESGKRLLPVAVSLVNYRAVTPLERIVVAAIETTLRSKGVDVVLTPVSSFLNNLKNLLEEPEVAESFLKLIGKSKDNFKTDNLKEWIAEHPPEAYMYGMRLMKNLGLKTPEALVEERHDTFDRVISEVKKARFDGLFLLIDELSEFFCSKPTPQALNEDARTLQLLGELTADEPLWIIAAVQESIERTGDISQVTFRKIKDRFPVKLTLSTVHIRSLISQRLVKHKPGADEEIYRIYEAYKRQFSTFSWTYDGFRQTYPVHPVTISLLDGLGELFSEHRGIVDFIYSRIAGDKRRNIQGILNKPASEILAPDSIYDHFELRLGEFSAFNVYPRHIIPHLNEVIEDVIEDEDDRVLAQRLIKILVLYTIHPTADTPPVGQLAEIAACALDFHMPGFNVQYIAEALLDPIVESSRFLIKRPSESGNTLDAVYSIITQDDPTKTLKLRIDRTAQDLSPDDSRLLSEPFSGIPESESWPGGSLMEKGVLRQITWHFSTRKILIRFLHENDSPDHLAYEISSGGFDFAIMITFGKGEYSADHTAVWQIPFPQMKAPLARLFKEFLATKLVASELKPSNPADAPLIQPVKDRLERLKPAVHQAALDAFYSGNFTNKRILVEPVVRQLKRFDRLLEAAGEVILDDRYPKFREIAPRRVHPSPRLYQRLLDEFVTPGSILLREAQAKSLGEAIDGLAAPLGIVELKGGSYIFSPDITEHIFLSCFFSLLPPAGSASITEVALTLQTGVYGLPKDTFLFLISSLACSGLITLLKNGRTIPIDFLNFMSAEKADEVAPGELINQNDKETLKKECSFLAPSSVWESFGLRQQREAWKTVIKFKETASILAAEIRYQLSQVAEFSAFNVFNLPAIEQKLNSLTSLADEIKTSYSAKEGLERFLRTWRGTGLENEDIQFIKKLRAFLLQNTEQFVFIHHYIHHSAANEAAKQDNKIEELRKTVLSLFEKPEIFIAGDEGKQLNSQFSHFREYYISFYSRKHAEYYRSFQKPSLSKFALRAASALEHLSAIEALDRPPGLEQFLREIKSPGIEQCARKISEELIRSPVCTCGYQPGDMPEQREQVEPEEIINRFFMEYVDIINNPKVLESITARAYAIHDSEPENSNRLKQISKIVQEGKLTSAHLLNIIDEQTTLQLSRALVGKVQIRHKKLSKLVSRLAGRRLTQGQVRKIVNEWASSDDENTLLAIEEDIEPRHVQASLPGPLEWWPLLHGGLFGREFQQEKMRPGEIEEIENRLEKQFPSLRLKETLQFTDTESLLRFITKERYHSRAVQEAWRLLAERILTGSRWPSEIDIHSSHADHDKAEKIQKHLGTVKMISERLHQQYPERLTMRIFTEELMFNEWKTTELQLVAEKAIQEVSDLGEDWLSKLPEVSSISLDDNTIIVIVDGAAPDVWLESIKGVESFKDDVPRSWARLEVKPDTVDSIARLFGFNNDPVEEFSTRNIVYHNLKGNEEHAIVDHVLPIQPDKPVVIRLGIIDRGAHAGGMRLSDMNRILKNILESDLPQLIDACRQLNRRLILTTDHGLSLTAKGLLHGKGGVYERCIFRAEWYTVR